MKRLASLVALSMEQQAGLWTVSARPDWLEVPLTFS
jgi:hypothetical protein